MSLPVWRRRKSPTLSTRSRFVQRLNQRERTTAYRLPTEFEWERAARAGASADPAWDEIRELAWEQDVTTATTHPVGSKKPNRWGLYDVLGNVWEWVNDWYRPDYYAQLAAAGVVARNPPGPAAAFAPEEPGVNKRLPRGGTVLCKAQYRSR